MAYNANITDALRPASTQLGTLDTTTQPTLSDATYHWGLATAETEAVLARAGLALTQASGTTAHTLAKALEAHITARACLLEKGSARGSMAAPIERLTARVDSLTARLIESAEELVQAGQAVALRTDADGTFGRAWSHIIDNRDPEAGTIVYGDNAPYAPDSPDFPADGEW